MTHFTDLLQPTAGTALMSRWLTGGAERSHAAAAAVTEEWAAAETAPAGRLAQHIFLALDGTGLLFYAQWTSDEAHLAWARAHRTTIVSRVDATVPGIQRPGLHRTRLDRSVIHQTDGATGIFAVSTMAAPDTESALAPQPGMLAAHVHLTPNRERVHLITEWARTASHEQALIDGYQAEPYTLLHALVDPV
ncbi:antibiotic biosynthesis monooxygenase [Streptomyces sp. NPDC055992]|uniref:antibiotic biosynthesis monooxygenase n=1 Tax=Streptomyces sp. NPDC055992 TaxID=3345673 RepID=UPI0035D9D738